MPPPAVLRRLMPRCAPASRRSQEWPRRAGRPVPGGPDPANWRGHRRREPAASGRGRGGRQGGRPRHLRPPCCSGRHRATCEPHPAAARAASAGCSGPALSSRRQHGTRRGKTGCLLMPQTHLRDLARRRPPREWPWRPRWRVGAVHPPPADRRGATDHHPRRANSRPSDLGSCSLHQRASWPTTGRWSSSRWKPTMRIGWAPGGTYQTTQPGPVDPKAVRRQIAGPVQQHDPGSLALDQRLGQGESGEVRPRFGGAV